VVLDEVDYMTNNAQQALRYILQNESKNARFCLICNYISRIDEGLQNEFLRLRFNQLPEEDILHFLREMVRAEKMNLSDEKLVKIQKMFRSDMRSMINYIQSNNEIENLECNILDDSVLIKIHDFLTRGEETAKILAYFDHASRKYNIDKKNIIKNYLNYIIRNNISINKDLLDFVENIMHFQEVNNACYTEYTVVNLKKWMVQMK
jgi:replication factor C subunit 3/5